MQIWTEESNILATAKDSSRGMTDQPSTERDSDSETKKSNMVDESTFKRVQKKNSNCQLQKSKKRLTPATITVVKNARGCLLRNLEQPSLNKTPAKAFTPPAEPKMGTRPGRAVTREFIEGGVYSLISVLPN